MSDLTPAPVMTPRDLATLRQQLVQDEGLRLRLYTDTVGKVTIGIGRNLSDTGISEDEAFYLCDNDMRSHSADLARGFPWTDGLDPVRLLVVRNMAFNLGIGRLSGFRRMLDHLRAGRYLEASVEMLQSQWARDVGPRAHRLARLMRTGVSEAGG